VYLVYQEFPLLEIKNKMGKYKHKNGEVGSGVALNMIKANSSQPFSLTSSPVNQGDGSRLKKKINKLSDKHEGLYNAVIEGYGQNEYTSGNYDRDMKRLYKVEDKLERKEKKYQSKFNKSPYSMQGPLNKGCAKSEGGPGCVQKKGNEYVIINNKKPGNQVWRGGFASKAEANKVLAGYHANK
jgi:hypothetical protein